MYIINHLRICDSPIFLVTLDKLLAQINLSERTLICGDIFANDTDAYTPIEIELFCTMMAKFSNVTLISSQPIVITLGKLCHNVQVINANALDITFIDDYIIGTPTNKLRIAICNKKYDNVVHEYSIYNLTIFVPESKYATNGHGAFSVPPLYSTYWLECGYLYIDTSMLIPNSTEHNVRATFHTIKTEFTPTTIIIANNGDTNYANLPDTVPTHISGYHKQTLSQIKTKWPQIQVIMPPVYTTVAPITIEQVIQQLVLPEQLDAIMSLHSNIIDVTKMTRPAKQFFNLSQIKWSNFMSYGVNNMLELCDSKLIGIFGPNGSGKTAIIDAICMLIYVRSTKDNISAFIHNSESSFTISGTINNSIQSVNIKRVRTRSGGNTDNCTITANQMSVMYTAISNLRQIQHYDQSISGALHVNNIVGSMCGQQDLALYTCILQHRYQHDLLLESPAVQKSILERLFGIDIVRQLHNTINAEYKQFIADNNFTAPCEEQLDELLERLRDLNVTQNKYKTAINKLRTDMAEIEMRRSSIIDDTPQASGPIKLMYKYSVENATLEMIEECISELTIAPDVETHISKIEYQISQLVDAIAKKPVLEAQLKHSLQFNDVLAHSCEVCTDHIRTLTNVTDIKKLQTFLDNMDKFKLKHDELCKTLENLLILRANKIKYDDMCEIRETLKSRIIDPKIMQSIISKREQNAKLAKMYDEYMQTFNELSRRIVPIEMQIADINNLIMLRKQYDASIGKLVNKKQLLELYKSLYEIPKKNIAAQIIENRMPNIINSMNEFLTYMDIGFTVKWDTSMQLIIGQSTISINMVSEFQYNVINIVMRVALWRQYIGLLPNFFIFDEALAHADSVNRSKLMRFYEYMLTWHDAPSFILLISNDEHIKHIMPQQITVMRDKDGESHIGRQQQQTDIEIKDVPNYIVEVVDGYSCTICNITLKKKYSIARHISSNGHIDRAKKHNDSFIS